MLRKHWIIYRGLSGYELIQTTINFEVLHTLSGTAELFLKKKKAQYKVNDVINKIAEEHLFLELIFRGFGKGKPARIIFSMLK